MKANEFVRKFGWVWAKEVVDNQPKIDAQIFNPYNAKYSSKYTLKKGVSVAHLKRLVESYELVESWGGLEDAKLYDFDSFKDKPNSAGYKLMQAIIDVEKCQ